MENTKKKLVVRPKKEKVSFPLFDSLVKEIHDDNLTEVDSKCWSQISKLDPENTKIIYYLILHYARINGVTDEIPYARNVADGGKGVIFNVQNLPHELQLIISRCVQKITQP